MALYGAYRGSQDLSQEGSWITYHGLHTMDYMDYMDYMGYEKMSYEKMVYFSEGVSTL